MLQIGKVSDDGPAALGQVRTYADDSSTGHKTNQKGPSTRHLPWRQLLTRKADVDELSHQLFVVAVTRESAGRDGCRFVFLRLMVGAMTQMAYARKRM